MRLHVRTRYSATAPAGIQRLQTLVARLQGCLSPTEA